MSNSSSRTPRGADRAPRRYIRPDLIEYLRRRPGVTVWLADICAELGVTNPKTVQQGINNLRAEEKVIGPHIEVLRAGQAWVYRPPAAEAQPAPTYTYGGVAEQRPVPEPAVRDARNELWERLGGLKDGAALLRDEEGNLWRAERM